MPNPAAISLSRPQTPPGSAPDDARDCYIRGLLALRDGDADAAVALLIAALRRQPSHQRMRRNLVRALIAAGRFKQALLQADCCLATAPDDAELHFSRGTALNALGDAARACAALSRAAALRPDHAASLLNLANANADLDDLDAAEDLCRQAIRLDPELIEAHTSLGFILTARGDPRAAIAACETAIRLSPDFTPAHWNLAVALLLFGDLARGFAEYEWRKRHLPYRNDFPRLQGPEWAGSSPDGRTILVRAEQGAGDAIQFARYLPLIQAAGGRPVLICGAALAPLIRPLSGTSVLTRDDVPPHYDAWIDQMSLPHVFGTTLDTIPGASGYLRADPERVATWRTRLPAGHKVGVAFSGNPSHGNDRRRSIPRDFHLARLEMPGVAFINLHHGASAAGVGLPDLSAQLTDYAETAAVVANLDLVITVDTSIAHLAGALGKPVWVLLPHAPDWRWLLGREDCPWYMSARLLRQPHPGGWSSVLARVRQELPIFLQSGPTI